MTCESEIWGSKSMAFAWRWQTTRRAEVKLEMFSQTVCWNWESWSIWTVTTCTQVFLVVTKLPNWKSGTISCWTGFERWRAWEWHSFWGDSRLFVQWTLANRGSRSTGVQMNPLLPPFCGTSALCHPSWQHLSPVGTRWRSLPLASVGHSVPSLILSPGEAGKQTTRPTFGAQNGFVNFLADGRCMMTSQGDVTSFWIKFFTDAGIPAGSTLLKTSSIRYLMWCFFLFFLWTFVQNHRLLCRSFIMLHHSIFQEKPHITQWLSRTTEFKEPCCWIWTRSIWTTWESQWWETLFLFWSTPRLSVRRWLFLHRCAKHLLWA